MEVAAEVEVRPAEPASTRDEPMCWRVHLAVERPGRAALLVAVALGSGALCYSLFGNWVFALASAGVLLAATAEFLFPVSYRLDEAGAEMRCLFGGRKMDWSEVRKAYLVEAGVKLSPLPRRSRLEAYRGVFLRFEGNRDEVLAAVRRHRERL